MKFSTSAVLSFLVLVAATSLDSITSTADAQEHQSTHGGGGGGVRGREGATTNTMDDDDDNVALQEIPPEDPVFTYKFPLRPAIEDPTFTVKFPVPAAIEDPAFTVKFPVPTVETSDRGQGPTSPLEAERQKHSTNKEPRRVIVKYKKDHKSALMRLLSDVNTRQRAAGKPMLQHNIDFDEMNTVVITADPDMIAEIENNRDVEYVETDGYVYPMTMTGAGDGVSTATTKSKHQHSHTSHHQHHSSSMQQKTNRRNLQERLPWGVQEVQAPHMWASGHTGQGVKVCVIDSGIDVDHSDFVTANLDGHTTDHQNGQEDLPWWQDDCGHGTHVAGTIAAKDNDEGVIGVAPDAEIFVVRVFQFSEDKNKCGWAFESNVMEAARTCRDSGANVINMSLGSPRYSHVLDSFFHELLTNDNIISIASAGNGGDTGMRYPASYDAVMSVAAVNQNMGVAPFSQRNDQVDIAAPGVDILSTVLDDAFDSLGGTSMAAPHVSGVAALLMSAVPSASAVDIRNAMESGAQDLGRAGKDEASGHGLVKASAALQKLATAGSFCTDSPPGWFDSDGSEYNCAWYASSELACKEDGALFENFGKTANEACCTCGGGSK